MGLSITGPFSNFQRIILGQSGYLAQIIRAQLRRGRVLARITLYFGSLHVCILLKYLQYTFKKLFICQIRISKIP